MKTRFHTIVSIFKITKIKLLRLIYFFFIIFFLNEIQAQNNPKFYFDKNFETAQIFLEDADYQKFDSINYHSGFYKTYNISFLILESYRDFLETYTSQSDKDLLQFYKKHEKRILELSKLKESNETKYVKAELLLHLAVIKFFQGEKWDGAMKTIQSYNLVKAIEESNPNFGYHKKLLGMYHIAIGYMPTSALKLLKIAGVKGDINLGIKELDYCDNPKFYFQNEVKIIKTALQIFSKIMNKNPNSIQPPLLPNRLWYNFGLVLINKRLNKNELALQIFNAENKLDTKTPIFAYHKANLLLYKLQTADAEKLYDYFVQNFKGKNYLKDASYKKYICQKLNDKKMDFYVEKVKIRQTGITLMDADKKAQKFTNQEIEPHQELLKTMLLMDGGYYKEAEEILKNIKANSLKNTRFKTEYIYRYARISENLNNTEAAKQLYKKTIDIQGIENYYFAPNSCLQLGFLYSNSDKNIAIHYFNKVLTYKKHEYKNSLDTKAKAALKQLNAE